MTAVDVTIIDQVSSGGPTRELVTRLTDLLSSLDRDHQPGGRMRWRVIPQAMRSEIVPTCEPDRRIASLNYAAWHAHVAGSRRWVPVGGRR
jgi:hypothetical protein